MSGLRDLARGSSRSPGAPPRHQLRGIATAWPCLRKGGGRHPVSGDDPSDDPVVARRLTA
jgi:hypothetical protein